MLKYIGTSFIVGVPARNLTDDEARQYGKKKLLSTGLYIEVREKKPRETVNKQAETAEVKDGWN